MFIQKIHIKNYRNFNNFEMGFHEGLNVIVGANNSGKTGLLSAINLLTEPSNISIEDFNKNNLIQFGSLYKENAPSIEITYYIIHDINEDDTSDEAIIRLVPFLDLNGNRQTVDEDSRLYSVNATVKAVYALDTKYNDEYRKTISDVTTYDDYMTKLNRFVLEHYHWAYSNGVSGVNIDAKDATNIFDMRFIGAERTSEEVNKETKREISSFAKDNETAIKLDDFKKDISNELGNILSQSVDKLTKLFEEEQNDIGLKKGNVAIKPTIKASVSVPDSLKTEVKDTKTNYIIPLDHNGLGYNNLISIYMLIKLNEINTSKDFRILCLEEPEAHLHPAMQYKLFKYLKKLDDDKNLKQQIFVTTHSSNISAVAGLDNMFMMAYNRSCDPQDCISQSLQLQFKDKIEAKKHLSKFLDVTRSDMLFADKVILVEGLAERLLLPYFMDKCGYSYEDEHVSIIEIGGKHFDYFVELFNGNALKKKVLCITDNDFKWVTDSHLKTKEDYEKHIPSHIANLKENFTFNEFKICTQHIGGCTFEDELFLTNSQEESAIVLLEMVLPKTLKEIVNTCGLNIAKWKEHCSEIDERTAPVIQEHLNHFDTRLDKDESNKQFYERLFFAELFLRYIKDKKGDIALQILTKADELHIDVPSYIKEGIEWLK